MFIYASEASKLAHSIILNHFSSYNIAIDATLGNGYDTDFLSKHFERTYSFDIQKSAIDNYSKRSDRNVTLIHDSHENFKSHINESVNAIIYNLGYLPGGDKATTTKWESTLKSIESGLDLLSNNGIMLITSYPGHEEGSRETAGLMSYCANLKKCSYGVVLHQFLNRKNAPILFAIEKK